MSFFELLDELGIEISPTLARFGGMEKVLEKFLLKFPEDETFQRIRSANIEHSLEDLERNVHTLKGLSGNLGLSRISTLCAECLTYIRKKDIRSFNRRFPDLQEEYQQAVDNIKRYRIGNKEWGRQ